MDIFPLNRARTLQRIPEMLCLLIRQIAESIPNSLIIFALTIHPIPPLVLPTHPQSQYTSNHHHCAIANDESRQCREITWRLPREEDIGSCNIARRVENEPHAVRSATLRMTRDVRRKQIPGQDNWSADDVLQPSTSDKAPAFR